MDALVFDWSPWKQSAFSFQVGVYCSQFRFASTEIIQLACLLYLSGNPLTNTQKPVLFVYYEWLP